MDPITAVKQLQTRKQDLLVESEINRQILRLECEQARFHVESWRSKWTRAQGTWRWAAPLAGLLFANKFRKTAGAFTAGSVVMPALRKLWEAWRARSKNHEE